MSQEDDEWHELCSSFKLAHLDGSLEKVLEEQPRLQSWFESLVSEMNTLPSSKKNRLQGLIDGGYLYLNAGNPYKAVSKVSKVVVTSKPNKEQLQKAKDEAWFRTFYLFVHFTQCHGHCEVNAEFEVISKGSQGFEEHVELGRWLQTQKEGLLNSQPKKRDKDKFLSLSSLLTQYADKVKVPSSTPNCLVVEDILSIGAPHFNRTHDDEEERTIALRLAKNRTSISSAIGIPIEDNKCYNAPPAVEHPPLPRPAAAPILRPAAADFTGGQHELKRKRVTFDDASTADTTQQSSVDTEQHSTCCAFPAVVAMTRGGSDRWGERKVSHAAIDAAQNSSADQTPLSPGSGTSLTSPPPVTVTSGSLVAFVQRRGSDRVLTIGQVVNDGERVTEMSGANASKTYRVYKVQILEPANLRSPRHSAYHATDSVVAVKRKHILLRVTLNETNGERTLSAESQLHIRKAQEKDIRLKF
eukprot:gene27029-33689_t